jgi:hypothetical protein
MRQINTFAERILSADDPHDVALELMGALIDFVAGHNVASRMYRIWGELTDWVDFQEPNEPIARAEMVRAAREWLALDTANDAAVNRYLDYWWYDVCGAARPPECDGGRTSSV